MASAAFIQATTFVIILLLLYVNHTAASGTDSGNGEVLLKKVKKDTGSQTPVSETSPEALSEKGQATRTLLTKGQDNGNIENNKKDTTGTPVDTNTNLEDTDSAVVANKSCENDTNCNSVNPYGEWMNKIEQNRGMVMRTFYVLLGVTSIVVIYFTVKAVRLRRRKSRTRRYGLLNARGDTLEMAPLDQDDDDEEDVTVFEMNGSKR